MTEKQRWFKDIFGALQTLQTEEELRCHLEKEDRRIEERLAEGPLEAGLVRCLYAQHDPLVLVLRARMHLEEFLDSVLAKKFRHSEVLLQGRSYSFSVKMDILRAANHIDEKMFRDLILISRLRNGFAHHLSSDIGEYDLSAFTECASLKAVLLKFDSPEAWQSINLFMFRQIVFQILVRLTARHKLFGFAKAELRV